MCVELIGGGTPSVRVGCVHHFSPFLDLSREGGRA